MVSQSLGAQLAVPRSAQVPAPSQVLGFCDFFLMLQVAAWQGVPALQRRQAPAPSHAPSRPQLEAGAAVQPPCGSVAPTGRLAQAPTKPGTLQD